MVYKFLNVIQNYEYSHVQRNLGVRFVTHMMSVKLCHKHTVANDIKVHLNLVSVATLRVHQC